MLRQGLQIVWQYVEFNGTESKKLTDVGMDEHKGCRETMPKAQSLIKTKTQGLTPGPDF